MNLTLPDEPVPDFWRSLARLVEQHEKEREARQYCVLVPCPGRATPGWGDDGKAML